MPLLLFSLFRREENGHDGFGNCCTDERIGSCGH